MKDAAPTLIAVTGYPASGKSSLARRLGRRLGLAQFSKDSFKERLFEQLGGSASDSTTETPATPETARAQSTALSRASIALLLDVAPPLLRAGQSLILEANFDRRRDSGALRAACQIHSRVVQIVCQCPPELLERRFRERIERGGRHACHDDTAYLPSFEALIGAGPCQPLDIRGAVIEVDTSRFSEALVDTLADQVRAAMDGAESRAAR